MPREQGSPQPHQAHVLMVGDRKTNNIPESNRPAGQSGLEVWEDPVILENKAGCGDPGEEGAA